MCLIALYLIICMLIMVLFFFCLSFSPGRAKKTDSMISSVPVGGRSAERPHGAISIASEHAQMFMLYSP